MIKSNFWNQLLRVVPLVILMSLMEVFICFTVAGLVMVALLDFGIPKYLILAGSVLTAIAVHSYILFNHKIRQHIRNQGARRNE